MGICWYCYWGWAKPVKDIYDRALEELGESLVHFGPAHIVFEDENFADHHIESCIKYCDEDVYDGHTEQFSLEDRLKLKQYLIELLAIPESIRDCCPEDYDDENPKNYPPPFELVNKR